MPVRDFYHVSLKAILKNDKGEVLILGGDPNYTFAGYYDLPGGRIDVSEFNTPLLDILRREIKEEVRLDNLEISETPVAIGRHEIEARLTKDGKPIHVLYIFFEGWMRSGEPAISSEHSSIRWVDLHQENPSQLFKSGILQGIEMYLRREKT